MCVPDARPDPVEPIVVTDARDAFNGKLLWKVPVEQWGWREYKDTHYRTRHDVIPVNVHRRVVATDNSVFATLGIGAPDLTHMAANNGGVYPRGEIEHLIASSDFRNPHGGSPMPDWEQQFRSVYFVTARNPVRRDAYARDRIRELTAYIETIQLPN